MAERTIIGQDNIVYSTEKDMVEQDLDAQDWESRFRKLKKPDGERPIGELQKTDPEQAIRGVKTSG